jgi:hypothetical protein
MADLPDLEIKNTGNSIIDEARRGGVVRNYENYDRINKLVQNGQLEMRIMDETQPLSSQRYFPKKKRETQAYGR